MSKTTLKELSLDKIEVHKRRDNFRSSIELLQKETDLLNGCDKDITKYYYINNICDLDDKSAENVAEFIKYRFFKKQIYTWSGQTLLAVQPYELRPQKKIYNVNEASINAVVSRAWFKLKNNLGKVNQTIVISGDSGSGKTYSGSVALKYLGSQSDICDDDVLNKVLYKTWCSVPVLAAFGNASTAHNTNSSRFGKLIQMQCRDGRIVGAYIQSFLLERSRVSGPNKGESNFHIFNQILGNVDEITLDQIYLNKSTEYKICPNVFYHEHCSFSDTLEAMKYLQFKDINNILRVLSLILNLGNIEFANKDDKLTIPQDCKHFLNFCAKIFQCNTSSLTQLFVRRLIAPKLRRGSLWYTSCVNIEECQERKNSLMRFLYDKLFNWLIESINNQIYYGHKHDCLGILDIYGFEVFAHNTFEQLCINYANERLQKYYVNDFYDKQVNYLYEKCEKITAKYDMSTYNKRINLMDGTFSVFGILNEECLIKRYNTDIFIEIDFLQA
ncbi:hypothetical protein HHI36_015380 [Cryptolaemus montrouzieri]|uniref:Myosin motor domain-containing protein n=1 Tax=Cryptolaemus montrouzieri TaxID=559131 RepID=A0ABD2N6A3_9CUCU